ncbi:hypothetical protein [Allofournierella sp.]|uniref:anti-sigma-I factor RsgI family protein n=1 Tax=Allofournierella sp. TaxID=1940256 RepID=UPI003AB29B7C
MLKNIKTHKTLAICLVGAALTACAGCAGWLLAPSQRIDLDVNPSIELVTNRLERVVDIRAMNPDAQTLLKGYAPVDRDLEDVVEELVKRMMEQGYLGRDKANDVLITVDDSTASPQVLDQVSRAVAGALERGQLNAAVHSQTVELKDYDAAARQLGVSAGRMAVIDRLAQGDGSLTPADLAETRVSDLLAYAQEKGIPLELLEDKLDRLEDVFDDDPALEALEDELDAAEDASEPEDADDEDDLDEPEDTDDSDDMDDLDDADDPEDGDDLNDPDDADDLDDVNDPEDPDDPEDADDLDDAQEDGEDPDED